MHRIEKAVTLQSRWWWSSSTYSSLVISFSVINYVVSVSFCAWGVITQRFKKVLIESKGFFCFLYRLIFLLHVLSEIPVRKTLRHSLVHDKTFSTHVVVKKLDIVSKSGLFTHERWAFSRVVPSPSGAHLMTLESGGDLAVGRGHVSFLGALIYNEL